eukprot:TRINITY_DN366_c0_g1_i1.p1 TRINITY_DN366_c0_g1~~TRINITY_DN366_c0_g1_i1.p1  ORF type:complete len:210 (+),score=57.50 TRINITY_DN366_c0_g1_i1:112-741(+)
MAAESSRKWAAVSASPGFDEAVPVLVQALLAECELGDAAPPPAERTVFDGADVPRVPVQDYVIRMLKYSGCSSEVFTMAALYTRRLRSSGGVRLTSLNVHRVLLACVVVAAKLRDDAFHSNRFYARMGGVELEELNNLERVLLDLLQWHVRVDPEEFASFRGGLLLWSAGAEERRRHREARRRRCSPAVSSMGLSECSGSGSLVSLSST